MDSLDRARETQLKNIQLKTGKTLEEIGKIVTDSGLAKHSEIREMLIRRLGLGYGDANAFVHYWNKSDGQRAAEEKGASIDDVVNELYSGAKTGLRPIHDSLMAAINAFGEFEIAPKKGYISLRRKKQFAMIGPATNSRVEVGLNITGLSPASRLAEMPPGGMCNYKVRVADPAEVDEELVGWIKQAFDRAG
jgi:hypothetical protein